MSSWNHGRGVRATAVVAETVIKADGVRKLVIPRHNPVNAITMGGTILDAGLSLDEFRNRL